MSTLSKFGNKSHEEARGCVCCVCGKKLKDNKGGVKVVSEKLADLVKTYKLL